MGPPTNAFYYDATTQWHVVVGFTAYHGAENGLTNGVLNANELWAFGDQMGAEVIGEDVAKKFFLTKCENLGIKIPDVPDDWPHIECYYLVGEWTELRVRVTQWLVQVRADQWQVGGDDSFYDYYPDNFFVADQICQVLNLEAELEEVRDYVKQNIYKGEEEEISRG